MSYGVQPTGFATKPLAVILAEIEAEMRTAFGADVIQSAQSPLGQINGIFAEAAAKLWELSDTTYASYDPDQAEGARLDILARIRLLERASGELDPSFRQAITNLGRARVDIADLVRAVTNVDGVSYAHAFVNDADTADANGVAGHSVCVSVLGGTDTDVAAEIRRYVVPGVGTHGNTPVEINVDGFCRTVRILRPTARAVSLSLTVTATVDRNGCPAPSPAAMKTALVEALSGEGRPINGADVTLHMLRTAMTATFPNVEITAGTACFVGGSLAALPLVVAFDEIATFAASNILINGA